MSNFGIITELNELKGSIGSSFPPGDKRQEASQILHSTVEVLGRLLRGPYTEALCTKPGPARDVLVPDWTYIKQHLDNFDPRGEDVQPIEALNPDLDYDPKNDEFFANAYDSQIPGGVSHNVYGWEDVLKEWNINRANQTMGNYTPLARYVLQSMTDVPPGSAPWIAWISGDFYINGVPTDLAVEEFQDCSRDAIWEPEAIEHAQNDFQDFLSDPEMRMQDEALLQHWRDERRPGGPANGKEWRHNLASRHIQQTREKEIFGEYAGRKYTVEEFLRMRDLAEEYEARTS